MFLRRLRAHYSPKQKQIGSSVPLLLRHNLEERVLNGSHSWRTRGSHLSGIFLLQSVELLLKMIPIFSSSVRGILFLRLLVLILHRYHIKSANSTKLIWHASIEATEGPATCFIRADQECLHFIETWVPVNIKSIFPFLFSSLLNNLGHFFFFKKKKINRRVKVGPPFPLLCPALLCSARLS